MTPFPSDDARKAAHARGIKPRKAPAAEPLSRRRPRLLNLDDRLRGLLAPAYDRGKVDAAVQGALKVLRSTPPRTLRDRPEDVVGKVYAELRKLANLRRDAAGDLVLAAEVVRAGVNEDCLDLLDAVKDEAEDLPFASPEVKEGFLSTVRHLRAWMGIGVSVPGAVADTRTRWQHDPRGHGAFLQGVEVALERFQSRHGGQT
jgi:hypothetical protein